MKNSLLVTVADKNYLNQAKQLFSSAYFNAGWNGDYMLLAHEINDEDLVWFENRKILIQRIEPLYNENFGRLTNATLGKFYLFKPEFKKWKNIIYLDVDIILRSPIDSLSEMGNFSAVHEDKFSSLFKKSPELEKKLKQKYNLDEPRFNSGVMAFNTDIITEDSFDKIRYIFEEYKTYNTSEQEAFNLFFYKKWVKLPVFYNTNVYKTTACYLLGKKNIKGVLHFIGDSKPWDKENPFYSEWKNNLEKAELINLENIPKTTKISQDVILRNSRNIRLREFVFYPIILLDKYVGKFGTLFRKYFRKKL